MNNDEMIIEIERLKKIIANCQWYWPEDDTSESNCAGNPQEVLESVYNWQVPTGEVVGIARGGIVEILYCAILPAASDSDSDDEFYVEEATQEAAQSKIDVELKRRASFLENAE